MKQNRKQHKSIRVKEKLYYTFAIATKSDFVSAFGTTSREVILARMKPSRRRQPATLSRP